MYIAINKETNQVVAVGNDIAVDNEKEVLVQISYDILNEQVKTHSYFGKNHIFQKVEQVKKEEKSLIDKGLAYYINKKITTK